MPPSRSRAVSFRVFFRKGPNESYREEAASREDAIRIADRMNKEHGKHGRRAIIYAVTPEGASLPVDISTIHEYGLEQKLSKPIRCF
jgi:hypothetical protein